MDTHQRLWSYSYSFSRQLHVINFSSNSSLTHFINSVKFEAESSWCEVPGSRLFFTGGPSSFTLDVLREFAISNKPPMLCARRRSHSSVCHNPYLYVIGGHDGSQWMEACERYSFQDNQWEVLPPLPTACYYSSAIVVEDAVYVLGGLGGMCKEYLNIIQKLCLQGMTWEVLQLKLPQTVCAIPCFKTNQDSRQVYFVLESRLYSFQPLAESLHEVKRLPRSIRSWLGPCYYSGGTLYCPGFNSPVQALEVGSLLA